MSGRHVSTSCWMKHNCYSPFSPWSVKSWQSKQKSEHLWGSSIFPLETGDFTAFNAAERLVKAGCALQATDKCNCLAKCTMQSWKESPLTVIAFPNQRSVTSQNRNAKHFQNVRRNPIFQLTNRKMRDLHKTWCAGAKQMQREQMQSSIPSVALAEHKQQPLHCHRQPLTMWLFCPAGQIAGFQTDIKKKNCFPQPPRAALMPSGHFYLHTGLGLKFSERGFKVSLMVTSTRIPFFPFSDISPHCLPPPSPPQLWEWPGARLSIQGWLPSFLHFILLSFPSKLSLGLWYKPSLQSSVTITWTAAPGPAGHMWAAGYVRKHQHWTPHWHIFLTRDCCQSL